MLKRINLLLVCFLIIFTLTGCSKDNDHIKFKKEYEEYNDILKVVSINEENPFIYSSNEEINDLIKNNDTFVVFYGNPKDEFSRDIVEDLINKSYEVSLGKIYYVKFTENFTLELNDTNLDIVPSTLVGVIDGNLHGYTNYSENILEVIKDVATKLNTCNINTGC